MKRWKDRAHAKSVIKLTPLFLLLSMSFLFSCKQNADTKKTANLVAAASMSVDSPMAIPVRRFYGELASFAPSLKVSGESANVAVANFSAKPNDLYRPTPLAIGPPLIEPRGMVKGKGVLYISDSGHDEDHSQPATIWRLDPETKKLEVFYRGPLLTNSKWLWFLEGANGRSDELLISDFGEESMLHREGSGKGAKVFAIEVRADGSAGATRILHQGPPFRDPQGITIIGETIIVADTRAGEERTRLDAPQVKFANGVLFSLPLKGGKPTRILKDQLFVTLVGACAYKDGEDQYIRFWDIDGARRDTSKFAWMPHSGFSQLRRARVVSTNPLKLGPVEVVPFIEEFPLKLNLQGPTDSSVVVLRGLNGTTLAGGSQNLVLRASGETTVIAEGPTTESKLEFEATIFDGNKPVFGPRKFEIPIDISTLQSVARDNKHAGALVQSGVNWVDVTVDGISKTVGLFPRQGGVISLIWQGAPLSTPMASQPSWDGSTIFVSDLNGGPGGTGAIWQLPLPSVADISLMYSAGNAWKVRTRK